MSNVGDITRKYLDKMILEELSKPTLSQLFRDYVPKWIGHELVWLKRKT